ncbi:hypothetical protein B0H14DRAFT_2638436 [Mycena olivaceomarginata]|nr:hypothetical protein B0H14DRAFT_2638436 [Mycena olivaceomarginata]
MISSHSVVVYVADGSAHSTAEDQMNGHTLYAVEVVDAVQAIPRRDATAIPTRDALKTQQVKMTLGHAPAVVIPAAVKDPPRALLPTSTPLSALAMRMSQGARTPPSASTGTASGEQRPASDLELQKIGISLKAKSGGQVEEQSKRIFIGSAEHKVLHPPPAPVLAYGKHAVKLGRWIVGQQDLNSNAGPLDKTDLDCISAKQPLPCSLCTKWANCKARGALTTGKMLYDCLAGIKCY